MYVGQTMIRNKSGLHARPAADFVKEAIKFKSTIKMRNIGQQEEPVNAKSLALVLSLSVACGGQIEISAEGEDAQTAVETLVAIIDAGLGEEE